MSNVVIVTPDDEDKAELLFCLAYNLSDAGIFSPGSNGSSAESNIDVVWK